MNPKRLGKKQHGVKPEGKQQYELELPELLESISLELKKMIYVDNNQKQSTMGQVRLEKYKNTPTALTKTSIEFVHKKTGLNLEMRKLRSTVKVMARHLAVDIYLLEGNSNLVLR